MFWLTQTCFLFTQKPTLNTRVGLFFLHNFLIILEKGVDFINEFATEKDLQKLRRLIDKTLLSMQF